MKDAGLSASCQLGNYPASLPGAAAPTQPAWLPSAQQLCCWWTRLIPRNAGLSSYSSVNDFIQQGEVTRGLVIKGLHFTVKTARLCAALQKSPLRKKRVENSKTSKCLWLLSRGPSAKKKKKYTSSHSCRLFPVSHCQKNSNWQTLELLAYTVATAGTMSCIGDGSAKCDFSLKEQRLEWVNGFTQ